MPFHFTHLGDLHIINYLGRNPIYKEFAHFRRYDRFKDSSSRIETWCKISKGSLGDFAICTGDLVDFFDESSIKHASKILSSLHCPFYFTPGNHDFQNITISKNGTLKVLDPCDQKDIETHKKSNIFKKYFKQNLPDWSFEHKGVLFMGLDNSNYLLNDASLSLLKQIISTQKPFFLFYHIPLDRPKLKERFPQVTEDCSKTMRQSYNTKFMTSLLESSGKFLGSFAGHLHQNSEDKIGNSYQFITRGGDKIGTRKIYLYPK